MAKLSRRFVLEDLQRVIAAELARTSFLDDWLAGFVVRDDSASASDERLYCSFFSFCDALGVADDQRPTFGAFGRAMGERGYPLDQAGPRTIRRGCRLLRRKPGAPFVDPEPLVDCFLAECCAVDGGMLTRVRSLALHEAYSTWAAARGAEPLSVKRLSASLRFRGFEKIHSNGIFWLSIELRASAAANPAPQRRAIVGESSGAEMVSNSPE